jgi:photosystem II stability/assembly factor-like uncharacterized protein
MFNKLTRWVRSDPHDHTFVTYEKGLRDEVWANDRQGAIFSEQVWGTVATCLATTGSLVQLSHATRILHLGLADGTDDMIPGIRIDQFKAPSGLAKLACLVLSLIACQQGATPVKPTEEGTPPATSATAIVGDGPGSETQPEALLPLLEDDLANKDRWQNLDTTGGGGQTSIATHPIDPTVVYMASDNGGLFKTENGGDSWFSVSSNLGAYRLGFVVLDPLDPDVIYVTASTDYGPVLEGGATGEIYRSLNGGLSWEFVSDAMGFQSSFPSQTSIVIPYDAADPGRFDRDGDDLSDVIVVGAWTGPADPPVGGVWRSHDEGKTFAHLALEDKNLTALRAFTGDADVLFASTYQGQVYRSEDLGTTWEDITSNMPLSHPSDLAVHPINGDILYVTCRWCQAGRPPVWRTTDGGQSWQATSAGLDSEEIGGFPKILIDRFDPNTLYVTTSKAPWHSGGVYRSVDMGFSWQLMPARLVFPDGRPYFWYQFEGKFALGQAVNGRLYAGDSAGWRYPAGNPDNRLEVWEPATLGIGNIHVNTIEVDPFDPAVLYQGISDRGPYKSVDRGASFHRILGNGWPVTVANYVWNGPYYSNYQECWLDCSQSCDVDGKLAAGGTTDFAISGQDSNIIYSAFGSGSGNSEHGGVNKSTDGGQTWQPVGFQLDEGFELNPRLCVPYGFRHLAVDPTDDGVLFAAMEIPSSETGRLYRTVDGGVTWTEILATSGYITGLEISTANPDLVVYTTRSEVIKSDRAGEPDSWQTITPPEVSGILTVALSPHQTNVYVIGTNNSAIYYTADGGINWRNSQLEGLFQDKLMQGSEKTLRSDIAAALNPNEPLLRNVSAIVFDPITPDVFYIAGNRYVRASFGVGSVSNAGQDWERLPLEGLSHRNVFDLSIDTSGEYLYAGTFNGTYRLKLR